MNHIHQIADYIIESFIHTWQYFLAKLSDSLAPQKVPGLMVVGRSSIKLAHTKSPGRSLKNLLGLNKFT